MRGSFLVIILLFLGSYRSYSVNYYFSSSTGSDSYSATQAKNPATPWKSIDKLNASMSLILPGDSILFKRGDAFSGKIILSKSGTVNAKIAFSSYGKGNLPVIKGTLPITGWTNYSGNIWVADCSQLDAFVNNLLINGKSQQIGRYPNADAPNGGYLNIDSHNGRTSITSAILSSTTNWANGQVVVRTRRWMFDNVKISSHSGSTLNFESNTSYELYNNYGFFIQNHLGTLDQNGEWYYNSVSKKMYLFRVINPNSLSVEATKFSSGFEATSKQHFIIENIEFTGAATANIKIKYSNNFEIRNCNVNESGIDAVNINDSKDFRFINNSIANSNNNALFFQSCRNIVIQQNKILNTGLRPGMSPAIAQFYGLYAEGGKITCESNVIDSVGYIGIFYRGDTILIKNNFINHFCLKMDDGGGLYTGSNIKTIYSKRVLDGNIIMNGIGAGKGTDTPNFGSAQGIYLDDRTDHVSVLNNTIANCNGYGIYVHNSNSFTLSNNVSYNNTYQLGFVHDNIATDFPIRNGIIENNIFYSRLLSQQVASFKTIKNDISLFGTFSDNYYCRPLNDYSTINLQYVGSTGSVSQTVDLKVWKETYKYDINSHLSPYKIPVYKVINYTSTNIFSNSTFDSNILGWSSWSNYSNGNIAWENAGNLNNGTMKLGFNTSSDKTDSYMYVIGNAGEVLKDESYIMKFSMISSDSEKKIGIHMLKASSPYTAIAPSQNITVTQDRKEYELLFTPNNSDANARIDFRLSEDDDKYWIDNVELYRANVKKTITEDSVKFFYNPSNSSLKVNDNNYYIDAKGIGYHNFEIQPFRSMVLLKVDKEFYDKYLNIIKVTSINVTSDNGSNSISAYNGTLQLIANVLPVNALNKSVTWSVQNVTGQATINSSGLLTAAANGSVIAKATANDGSGVSGSLTITISGQKTLVTNITLSGANGINAITSSHGTLQLSHTVSPVNATNNTVTWSIAIGSNNAVINSTGLLSAVANGTVVVKATANDGSGVTATLEINISNQITDNNPINKKTKFYINPENHQDQEQNGTMEHPFDSWQKITWSDGDSILQKKGTVANEESILMGASNIYLGSYGTGDLPIIESNTSEYVFRAFEKQNIQIRGLHIKAEQALSCIYMIGDNCKSIQIMNCRFEGAENGIRIMGGDDLVISRNIFAGNTNAIYHYAKNSLLYYNIFKNNVIGVSSQANTSASYYYNNVFYNNETGISNTYSELTLYNNIFYMEGNNDIAIDHRVNKLMSDHNIFYPERTGFVKSAEKIYNNLADLQQYANLDRHSLTSNPRFMNVTNDDFTVEPGSPAIDAGKVVGLLEDFFGNSVPQGGIPDIGLSELSKSINTSDQNFNQNSQEHLLKVYPNPSNGRFNIQLKHSDIFDAVVSVKDLSGKTVYNSKYTANPNLNQEIDLTNYPNGIYIVVIETENKTFNEPVVINH